MTCISPVVVILNIILAITFDDVVDAATATITVVINKKIYEINMKRNRIANEKAI